MNLKAEDYSLTFETQGVAYIFEDIIAHCYMPPDSIIIVTEGGVSRNYVGESVLERMKKEGALRFPEEVQAKIEELDKTLKTATSEFDEMLRREITEKDLTRAFELFCILCQQYFYFDSEYWDLAFEKAQEEPRIKKSIELVEWYKNKAREELNLVFFTGGYMMKIIDSLSIRFGIPVMDLAEYSRQELLHLLNGPAVSSEILQERKQAYVIYLNQHSKSEVCSGQAAIDSIKMFDKLPSLRERGLIRGKIAHSTGKVIKAKVRVISRNYTHVEKMHAEMEAMERGEVLVTETTDPEMMPVLRKASAAVTDIGGMLSHTAITARELNIPCIVGTGTASKILKTGDLVEVDAEKGLVRIIKKV